MANITSRLVKGSPLTFTEIDNNFINLNLDKLERVISVNDNDPGIKITQSGAGNALLVEDSSSPDASPFIIDANGNVQIPGNIIFSEVGSRILGDFSNVTPSNRVAFQTKTSNTNTTLTVIPNGSGSSSAINLYTDSLLNGGSVGISSINESGNQEWSFNSTVLGSGTYLPITYYTSGLERFRISTNGNIGIGTSSPAQKLSVIGTASINGDTQISSLGVGTSASGVNGEIRASNNITAYFSSDIKFKENIKNIEYATVIVSTIGAKTFDWTDEYISNHGGQDEYFLNKSDFGVIAQDVQAVFPLAVKTRPDGSLAVDYSKLCVLAFAAIKELNDRISVLEGK